MIRYHAARMRKTILVVLLLSAAGVLAQGPPRPEAQIEAMKKLEYLAGTWEGEGWMEMGSRVPFRGSEIVQSKLDGTALLVEGAFFARPAGAPAEIPVHTTLGVISYDAKAKSYRFASWLANGGSGERELTVGENTWSWELVPPMGGKVRYTFTLTEEGEWFEIGERSKDGAEWKKFFEMRLKKK